MSQPSNTPETDHQGFTVLRLGKDIQAVPADFARKIERQRNAAREDAEKSKAIVLAAYKLRDSGHDGPFIGDACPSLFEALAAKN